MAVNSSEIIIGRGAFGVGILPAQPKRRRVAILSQPGARAIAHGMGEALTATGLEVGILDVPDGEAAKTLPTAERIYEELNRLGLSRYDTVLAVGGGAVTDLGGFIAATYLRGIEAVYCATTLLGAVDAAIGGKTGINVGGKNLVGVFAHPTRIVIDLDVLEALPMDLRTQGMAEVLKAGLVGDHDLVGLLEQDGLEADLEEVVNRAVDVKMAVVAGDFREADQRAILNYGHTIGHAVEVVAGISHGESVALGMVAAGVVSEHLVGFDEAPRVKAIIERLGLPVLAPAGLDRRRLLDLVSLDKKRDTSGIRMVLLEAIGRPLLEPVDETTIESALDAILPRTGNG